MKEFTPKDVKVNILGKDYSVRELSLSEKNKFVGPIAEFIKTLTKNAFFKKSENGNIAFNFVDEVSLAELNIDQIILNSINILPELLRLAIPDFLDWDNLPESKTREPLIKVLEVNDFKGYFINFISLATKIIR